MHLRGQFRGGPAGLRNHVPVVAGLISLITLLAIILLTGCGAGKTRFQARFKKATGLQEGAEVYLRNEPIGKIYKIKVLSGSGVPDEKLVEVTMIVNNTVNGRPITESIRTDSTAQKNGFGGITISPGTELGVPLSNGAVLPTFDR